MVTKKRAKRGSQNTVKIDRKLLKRIKILLNKEEMRIKYPTLKNFIDVAVLKLLKEEGGK